MQPWIIRKKFKFPSKFSKRESVSSFFSVDASGKCRNDKWHVWGSENTRVTWNGDKVEVKQEWKSFKVGTVRVEEPEAWVEYRLAFLPGLHVFMKSIVGLKLSLDFSDTLCSSTCWAKQTFPACSEHETTSRPWQSKHQTQSKTNLWIVYRSFILLCVTAYCPSALTVSLIWWCFIV